MPYVPKNNTDQAIKDMRNALDLVYSANERLVNEGLIIKWSVDSNDKVNTLRVNFEYPSHVLKDQKQST